MFNTKNLLFVILIAAAFNISAQAPAMLNYQAIVRNAAGNPVAAGTVVNLRFSIHDASANGTVAATFLKKKSELMKQGHGKIIEGVYLMFLREFQ